MSVLIEGQTLVLSWLTNGDEISPPLGPAHQIPKLFWRHGSRAKLSIPSGDLRQVSN
jgi:hypothetical protein